MCKSALINDFKRRTYYLDLVDVREVQSMQEFVPLLHAQQLYRSLAKQQVGVFIKEVLVILCPKRLGQLEDPQDSIHFYTQSNGESF